LQPSEPDYAIAGLKHEMRFTLRVLRGNRLSRKLDRLPIRANERRLRRSDGRQQHCRNEESKEPCRIFQ
jgi:hypothetical protein